MWQVWRSDAADDAVSDAEDQFVLIQPTTVAGVAAVLRYVGEHSMKSGNEIWNSDSHFENDAGTVHKFSVAFFLTLADSLERIVDGRPIEPGQFRRHEESDEEDEPEVVAQEPPEPWTREEEIAAHRRVLDHCTKKIAELESAGVTGASHV